MTRRLSLAEATDLAARAARTAGASEAAARSLARATVSANAHGKGSSGFSHLMDYLTALRAGRIVGDAEPLMTSPAPAAIHCDARGGIAQLGFDRAFDDLRHRAETFGIALFAQSGSYTTGELGYYPRRLAEAGLVAFAATSGPALMTVPGAQGRPSTAPIRSPSPRRSTMARRCSSTRRRARPPLSSLGAMPSAARRCRRAGLSTPMGSRPPIRTRRCAGRCWRSAARAAPISR